jgi:hypothetical protein
MPIPIHDPKFAELRAAGVAFSDQVDARLFWLEREVERLSAALQRLEHRLQSEAEMLGDGLERLERRLEGEVLEPELDL